MQSHPPAHLLAARSLASLNDFSFRSESDSSAASTRSPSSATPRPRSSSLGKNGKRPGIVPRTKDGCWSCRIRRKKCGGPSDTVKGDCVDCVRLNIKCLGWGEKRPEWLKSKKDVDDLRNRFTESLRSRNMIKGDHRRSSVDNALKIEEDHADYIGYHEGCVDESIEEVARPIVEVQHDVPIIFRGGLVSDPLQYSNDTLDSSYISQCNTPWSTVSMGNNVLDSLVPFHSCSTLFGHRLAETQLSAYQFSPEEPKARPFEEDYAASRAAVSYYPLSHGPAFASLIDSEQVWWFNHYVKNVLPLQYLMEGKDLGNVMIKLAQDFGPSAMTCLAAVHDHQSRGVGSDPRDRFLASALSSIHTTPLSTTKAMTALHLVSVSLFSGCAFQWADYLNIARDWYQQVITKYDNVAEFMRRLWESDDLTKFVSKTTMWMDIFGAVSSQTAPRFLNWYRALFKPALGGLVGYDRGYDRTDAIQMNATMGAENEVMLAFAEIAELDAWKVQQKHCLSIPTLVEEGAKIERELLTRRGSPTLTTPSNFYGPPVPRKTYVQSGPSVSFTPYSSYGPSFASASFQDTQPDGEAEARRLTSAVFRASARIYLNTVLSGCKPQVPEIKAAVRETVDCLRALVSPETKQYDRSLVLPLFIAGVMTDDPDQQQFIWQRLSNIKNIKVGNCGQVRQLMEKVWQARRESGGAEVNWRDTMNELGMTLLFV